MAEMVLPTLMQTDKVRKETEADLRWNFKYVVCNKENKMGCCERDL